MIALLLATLLAADPYADFAAARALAGGGDFQGAAERLKAVTAVFPQWGLAHVELADVLMKANPDDPAIDKALAEARTLEPLNPRAWLLSARLGDRRGDLKLAVDSYSRALELRPDLLDAREGLGLALAGSGRYAEAAPHLKAAVESRPGNRTTRAILAEAYEKSGDVARAEKELEALVASAPKNPAYRRRLLDFYERTGQAQKADAERRYQESQSPGRKLRPLPPSTR